MSEGSANAQQLGQLSSKLGRAAYKAMTSPSGDRDLGKALYAVKDHADDLVESTLSAAERAAYSTARGQYRNLMTLTSRTGIVNPSTGNVSGTALATKLQQADRPGFLFGKNQTPLYQAARFAQAFKPIVGDSGTATRSAHLFSWPAALAEHVAGGSPLESLLLGIAPRIAGNLAARTYLSPVGSLLTRGAMAAPGATASAARTLATNPAVWAQSPIPKLLRGQTVDTAP
jgi:hypothetical protein